MEENPEQESSSSTTFHNSANNELQDLEELAGINVWGQHQTVLEQQALNELSIFNKGQNQKEDGELSDNETLPTKKTSNQQILDINAYIKKQEELKKRQVHKKSLSVSHKSLEVANKISKKQLSELQNRKKRKSDLKDSKGVKKMKKNAKSNSEIETGKGLKKPCTNINEEGISELKLSVDNGEAKTDLHIEGSDELHLDQNKTVLSIDDMQNVDSGCDVLEEKSSPTVNNTLCENEEASGSDYVPSDPDSDYEPGFMTDEETQPKVKSKTKKVVLRNTLKVKNKAVDDGCEKAFKKRLDKYYKDLEKEQQEGNFTEEFIEIKPGFKILSRIWNNLYSYQQEGVEWLWGLHNKSTGGLLGDEMGLGKTVQIIAFLFAVNYSRNLSNHGRYTGLGPSIIVCPSTVVHQWVKHFHTWAPEFRTVVLHSSGSYSGNKIQLIRDMNKAKAIIVTTYQTILKFKRYLTELNWHYVILDEGHIIRNHGSKVSVAVKEFNTPHRLLLTGSPMQNNLQELWSLFDFINPSMLGTLPVFLEHFANPIIQGGYSNASPMQEALALSMATGLKNLITPHMLRRSKSEVQQDIQLPEKSEQVLFCSLTREQRDLYKGYLMGEQVTNILGRGSKNWFSENHTRCNVLIGITTLRKICNHPDIYLNDDNDDDDNNEGDFTGPNFYKRSGKMIVVSALLKIWKKQNHRVLLFTQSRAMIKIFERFLKEQSYKYLKMDGGTAITSRQGLIEKFNQDSSYDVFLLTTRVGGLGVNLTGANRVIIYDPDWNPATDTQARERAWRIGQEKQVTVYRLLSAGTIEEKMYQRQVWKQLLSNKVLSDPKTQKFFKTSDLHDLFSLQEDYNVNPETANIFQNSRISLEKKIKEKSLSKKKKESEISVNFSDEKIERMKQLAAQIAKNISSEKKEPDKKTPDEIEEERLKRQQEKSVLKKMSAPEILKYNREKNNKKEEIGNKIDDHETDVSFTKALIISEKSAELYKETKEDKNKIDKAVDEYSSLTKVFSKKGKEKKVVDQSGEIDGEKVEGLLKREVKSKSRKKSSKKKSEPQEQDNYVLNKLFSKNGIHSALQHDVIVQSGSERKNSIKIRSETQAKMDLAMQALSKSRLNKWRW